MIFSHKPPLSAQVLEAEQQLVLRRLQLHADALTLDAAIRKRLTAPDVLLWGVASGFALGELSKKRSHAEHPPQPSPQAQKPPPGTLQLLLRYWAVARPIVASVSSFLTARRGATAAESRDDGQARDEGISLQTTQHA